MAERKRSVLVPRYMQSFACIGSDCEDTCCVGWQVNVDHTTYRKYNKVRDLEMKSILSKHVKRNRSNPSEEHYAKIVTESKETCPLLNEEKLCSVHLKLGEDYLSNVCATYPRTSNIVNSLLEKSATMSCPEAARLALLNPNGIEFDEVEEAMNVRNIIHTHLDTTSKKVSHKVERYFWELRIFTIQVLQNRTYSIAERLIILGLFCQKVQECVDDNRAIEIPQLIASYANLMKDGGMSKSLTRVPTLVAIQMQLLKELVDIRVQKGIRSQRYMECFTEVLIGLQFTEEATMEEIAERYQHAHDDDFLPFMAKREYIFENYLVNYVYRHLFPLTKDKTIFDEYVMLVVHYAMIKLHLIGMAGFHKEAFNEDHVIKLIQSFAKTVEHSTQYLHQVFELLKKNEYTTMAYMTILINN